MPSAFLKVSSRTKEANPYESTAITEVRVQGGRAELARVCFPDQSLSRVQRTGPTASREAYGWPMVGRAPGRRSGRVRRTTAGGQR